MLTKGDKLIESTPMVCGSSSQVCVPANVRCEQLVRSDEWWRVDWECVRARLGVYETGINNASIVHRAGGAVGRK